MGVFWRRLTRGRSDSGFSLVELMVAMSLLGLVCGLVAVTVQQGGTTVVKASNLAASSDQARLAFARLDRDVRTAYAVNRPVRVGNNWYLELASAANGSACTQWRVLAWNKTLQVRSWTVAGSAASGTTAWQTVATGVVNDPTTIPPFTFQYATQTMLRQGVIVRLLTKAGQSTSGGVSEVQGRLVARNTSLHTPTNRDADGDGVSDIQVCQEVDRT